MVPTDLIVLIFLACLGAGLLSLFAVISVGRFIVLKCRKWWSAWLAGFYAMLLAGGLVGLVVGPLQKLYAMMNHYQWEPGNYMGVGLQIGFVLGLVVGTACASIVAIRPNTVKRQRG